MLDEVVDVPVVEVPLNQTEVYRCDGFHLVPEQRFQQPDILDDGIDLLAVESKCLFELVEDTDKIEHEAVRLHHLLRFVLVGAVHPCDCLQEGMVAHRLVEVHGVKHRCIESGKQFFGDDEDLRLLVELAEAFPYLPLLIWVKMEFLEQC